MRNLAVLLKNQRSLFLVKLKAGFLRQQDASDLVDLQRLFNVEFVMQQQEWISLIQKHQVIAVIRASDVELGHRMAIAVARGGIRLIEVTWNSEQPAKLIQHLKEDLTECTIGTGTLFDPNQMQQAIAAGAGFLFTPHVDPYLIQMANDREVPIIPGALTPSEIIHAWQAGASSVKVFPVQSLGGASYIRSLQGPLGQIPLIPTGGVTVDNAAALLAAGAIGVGMAGSLFPEAAMRAGEWEEITQRTRRLLQALEADRSNPSGFEELGARSQESGVRSRND